MISKTTARIINMMPKPVVIKVARFIINKYISKYANITVYNKERLEDINGPAIFISNHLSNSDGLVLNKVLKDKDVWFVAGIKLSKNDLTNLGLEVVKFIPINPNSADKAAISKLVNILKSGQSICIFPEGTRSRKGSMIEGKKGVLLIHKLTGAPLVPIGITGTEKLLPINDEDMGKEIFNYSDVTVTIGESFFIPKREKDESKESYQESIMYSTMRKIAELLPEKYQGVYRKR